MVQKCHTEGSSKTATSDNRNCRLLLPFPLGHRYIEDVNDKWFLRRETRILRAQEVISGHTTKLPNLCIIDCASGFSENVHQNPLPSGHRILWRFFEMNNFSRATSAFVLTASLLMSSVAALAQTQTPTNKSVDQTQKTTQTQSEENKTQTEQKTDQKAAAQPAPAAVKSSGKLSTNEDPNMIGKRNINTGIIAKMSGSTEKEVRMGREAAAEVDRQAKFVD